VGPFSISSRVSFKKANYRILIMKHNVLWTVSAPIGHTLFSTFYDVGLKGTMPKSGPCVLLPKHQSGLDIPLEGFVTYYKRREQAHFLMREFPFPLNKIFELWGGDTVVREKDKEKYSDSQRRRTNSQAVDKMLYTLSKGGVGVVYTEGTRAPGYVKPISIRQNSTLDRIIKSQESIGRVSFITVRRKRSGRQIQIRLGVPYFTDNRKDLEQHLQKEIQD